MSVEKLEELIETMENQMRSGKYNEISFYMACKALRGVRDELNHKSDYYSQRLKRMSDFYAKRERTLIESRDRFLKRSQELQWMFNKMMADKNER